MPQDKDKTDVLDAKTLSAVVSGWTSYKWTMPASQISNLRKEPKNIERSTSQEPIVGYRVWKLKDGLLQSGVMPDLWPARQRMTRGIKIDLTNRQVNINPLTGKTTQDKSIGIHATKTERAIFEKVSPEFDIFENTGLWDDYKAAVAGEVWLWGEVKECQYGWLAEFAYPKRLWLPETADVLTLMQLEQNYGVPVETRPDLGDWKPNYWDRIFSSTPPFHLPTKSGKSTTYYQHSNPIIVQMTDEEKKKLDKQIDNSLDK